MTGRGCASGTVWGWVPALSGTCCAHRTQGRAMRRTGGSRARRSTPTSLRRRVSRSRGSWSTRCATGMARLWGLVLATDMLVEITCGYTSPHEEEVGSAGLADRCRAIVRHACPACTGWGWPWAAVRDTPGSPGEGEPVVIRGAEPDDREDEDLPRRRQPECRADPPL